MKIVGLLFLTSLAQAFTQVVISTGAPAGLETQFLAATTSQFNAKVVKNPLVPNTYATTLYGLNPSYVAPSTATCFNIAVDIDTTSLQADLNALVNAGPQIIRDPYVYGYAAGEAIRNWVLSPAIAKLTELEKNMSALDDKITAINAAVTKLGTDLTTLIADLKSNTGSGAPTAAQLASLDTIASALTSLDSTVTSADPGTPAA